MLGPLTGMELKNLFKAENVLSDETEKDSFQTDGPTIKSKATESTIFSVSSEKHPTKNATLVLRMMWQCLTGLTDLHQTNLGP